MTTKVERGLRQAEVTQLRELAARLPVDAISGEELVETYRRFGSRLPGHPTPALPWVDVATGSLGQGLPAGVGVALAGQYLDRLQLQAPCCAATARWPRVRCGRPWTRPTATGCATSPRLHNCLAAADQLVGNGISAQVIGPYSVKPVDRQRLVDALQITGGRLLVIEDHYPQGGLGAAVLEALADLDAPIRLTHLAVRGLPTSGTSAELWTTRGSGARHRRGGPGPRQPTPVAPKQRRQPLSG